MYSSDAKSIEEVPEVEVPQGVFMLVTALLLVGVLWTAYWFDRIYRRWWKANHPFADFSASIDRLATTYRKRRASVGDAIFVVREVVSEVDRALESEKRRQR
jgi:hypothetical protein